MHQKEMRGLEAGKKERFYRLVRAGGTAAGLTAWEGLKEGMVTEKDKEILRGWQAICDELGGISENTARKLVDEEGLPVVIIANSPTTTKKALCDWIEKKLSSKI
jgi:hypothetical protein